MWADQITYRPGEKWEEQRAKDASLGKPPQSVGEGPTVKEMLKEWSEREEENQERDRILEAQKAAWDNHSEGGELNNERVHSSLVNYLTVGSPPFSRNIGLLKGFRQNFAVLVECEQGPATVLLIPVCPVPCDFFDRSLLKQIFFWGGTFRLELTYQYWPLLTHCPWEVCLRVTARYTWF